MKLYDILTLKQNEVRNWKGEMVNGLALKLNKQWQEWEEVLKGKQWGKQVTI